MPWSDNSGNNGNNGRGPWGQPPKNNGGPRRPGQSGDAPDLEELLQASRERLKRAFPSGGGRRGGGGAPELNARTIGFGAAVAFVLFLFSGVYFVQPQEQAVVTTFGQYANITGPGPHWRMPVAQAATIVPVDQQQTAYIGFIAGRGQASSQENLMLTSDRNIVDISFSVDWKVNRAAAEPGELPNAAKLIFNIDDPEKMVKAVAEAAMRETIGSSRLDPIITSGQALVTEQTRVRIQEVLDSYDSGIEILRVNMEKPEPPAAVREAFVDVVKARSEKEEAINNAERLANQIIPVAEGEARRIIEGARAYAARVEADSLGQANRFDKIFEEYRRAPEVTRQRMYLETVEDVLGDMNKIIVEDDAGSGVVPYLPLNELNRRNGNN